MAKKKNNLKDLGEGELAKELASAREALRAFRFKAEGAKSKNVKETLTLKKNIARLLTEVNAR